jgi:hypothetical protein
VPPSQCREPNIWTVGEPLADKPSTHDPQADGLPRDHYRGSRAKTCTALKHTPRGQTMPNAPPRLLHASPNGSMSSSHPQQAWRGNRPPCRARSVIKGHSVLFMVNTWECTNRGLQNGKSHATSEPDAPSLEQADPQHMGMRVALSSGL